MAVRWRHCGCAPIKLAQCRLPWLAISNAKILIYIFFSNKIYESNCIKQHAESVMVRNYQTADCILRKEIYCVIYYNFRHTFVPSFTPAFVKSRRSDHHWHAHYLFTYSQLTSVVAEMQRRG